MNSFIDLYLQSQDQMINNFLSNFYKKQLYIKEESGKNISFPRIYMMQNRTNKINYNEQNRNKIRSIQNKKMKNCHGLLTAQKEKLYKMELQSILSHVAKEYLTFQQLYLICYESNIKLLNPQESEHLKSVFKFNEGMLPLRDCISMLKLQDCQILHNRPLFYVTLCSPHRHQHRICFAFWKELMQSKYGSQMRWFDALASDHNARKIKSFPFKCKIKQLLQKTEHQDCCDIICEKFPKNTRNQIQWSTFMAVIRHIENKYRHTYFQSENQKNIQHQRQYSNQKTQMQEDQDNSKSNNQKSGMSMMIRRSRQGSLLRKYKNKKNQTKKYSKQQQPKLNKFMMMSSLEISKQHDSISRKFRAHEKYQMIKIGSYRATSAKFPKKTNAQQYSLSTTTTNWKSKSPKIGIQFNDDKIAKQHSNSKTTSWLIHSDKKRRQNTQFISINEDAF